MHLLCVCRHAPEFEGSDSFDSYTSQWPDLGDNPSCRHKAIRKAPIPPCQTQDWSVEAVVVVLGAGGGAGVFRRKTSSHSPQYTSPHSTPLAHEWGSNWFFFTSVHFPTWPDTERGFWAHLPFLVYFISRRRLIEREGKKKGIFIRKRINAQSAPFGRYIRPIH